MKRVACLLGLMMAISFSEAQIHVSKLVIKAKQKYSFDQSDIVVADTLIMEDSSTLVLNKLKKENYLHSKVTIIGRHCTIDGSGVNGGSGRDGRIGTSPIGPCKNGTNGTNGSRGLEGTAGVNLFIYLQKVTIKDYLTIDLRGGDGGNGGRGGEGGSGTSGTVHCKGGDGGIGGNAGNGANGGQGGSLTITFPSSQKELVDKHLKIKNSGGRYGKGGRGGYPGSAGLGPKRGKPGMPGTEGIDGQLGKNGSISIVLD
jgi:hypothetical protein